jgi:membrane-associated HD superfamily phosphohydrolase
MKVPTQDKTHKSVEWANVIFAYAERACALVLLCSFVLILTGGCGPQEPPSVKKCRVIAAENAELKKQLAKSNKEIEMLKEQYSQKIDEQRERLQKCLQEKEELKEKSRQNIRNQVKGVLDTVLDENTKLREENTKLKAQVEKLQK